MKKIIFYNSNKVWGGGEKWHFKMALALKELKFSSHLITNPNSELEQKSHIERLETTSFNTKNLSFLNPIKIYKLYKILKELKPTAIFLNLPSDVKMCAPIAKLAGVKKVIYRRGMPNPIKNTFINRYVYSKVDIIIANSIEIKKTIIQNLPILEEKVMIVYNGVHPLNTPLKEAQNPIRLGNLGRMVEQKGQEHLINIGKILNERNFPFILSIAGKGPLETNLQDLINKYNLSENIKLIGHMDPKVFFEDIDLFVFTSHFEGSANALIESLQHGVPALAFDISSNPEVIQNNKTGYLIKPFDENQMADKIIELSKDSKSYRDFQKQGLELIKEKFDYDKKINQIVDILNE